MHVGQKRFELNLLSLWLIKHIFLIPGQVILLLHKLYYAFFLHFQIHLLLSESTKAPYIAC